MAFPTHQVPTGASLTEMSAGGTQLAEDLDENDELAVVSPNQRWSVEARLTVAVVGRRLRFYIWQYRWHVSI